MRSGLIVAGGRSTRFGDADKAVAELAGTPMIRRVADRLETVVDNLVINCRRDQREAIEAAMASFPLAYSFAVDTDPDRGPMAGIRNGLDAVDGEYAAVVACDMPFVDPDLLEHLFDRAAGHDAAVPQLDDEWFQTTQAVYRTEAMLEACDTALARGDRRIVAPLEDLEYVVVDEESVRSVTSIDTFENCNTRAEFQQAAARLSDDE